MGDSNSHWGFDFEQTTILTLPCSSCCCCCCNENCRLIAAPFPFPLSWTFHFISSFLRPAIFFNVALERDKERFLSAGKLTAWTFLIIALFVICHLAILLSVYRFSFRYFIFESRLAWSGCRFWLAKFSMERNSYLELKEEANWSGLSCLIAINFPVDSSHKVSTYQSQCLFDNWIEFMKILSCNR